MIETITIVLLVLLNVFQAVLGYVERKRLTNCVMSKNYSELVQGEIAAKVPFQQKTIQLPLNEGPTEVDEINQIMGLM